MDPNLYHLDYERLFEVLVTIIVLSFFVERALAVLFEHRKFIDKLKETGVKEVIALVVSIAVCIYWDFDAVSMTILAERTSLPGHVLTGGIIAGGSKASIKLFRDLMGVMSDAEKSRKGLTP